MPTPALIRDKWVHIRLSRGSEYSSCASSTANRASCVCAGRENVEDHFGAIKHFHAERGFEIANLRWREIVVEDHDAGVRGLDHPLELFELALAQVGGHVGHVATLGKPADDFRPRRFGQTGELA